MWGFNQTPRSEATEIGHDAGMEIRKEAGEAFFQEMQVPRAKPLCGEFAQKFRCLQTFFLVKRWEKVGGGSGVVVVVSTREKQKTKGKQKKEKQTPKHGGFSCPWFDQRNSKKCQDYVQEVAAANTYLGRFGITRGGGTTISTARSGML